VSVWHGLAVEHHVGVRVRARVRVSMWIQVDSAMLATGGKVFLMLMPIVTGMATGHTRPRNLLRTEACGS
jgi:hypothetical protein